MGETATASFDGWYRQEHPRVLALLTVASGDAHLASEVTAEAFTRALERWTGWRPWTRRRRGPTGWR